ncbi:SAM-dependent DNA methyltransferase [Haloarcula sp. CBA1131]|uniref:N-6 DNA methylase n=1 Tax=Haloarcula sp. CBA1131 TaxID=1853686 RepID=UPI0012455F37|nr:N-6 DNA methylase [Haloarcula sp. CBA1131]KAA9405954.1 SAM-dependent DNA methyltransferase [Haloarcula sp. CBA1131]
MMDEENIVSLLEDAGDKIYEDIGGEKALEKETDMVDWIDKHGLCDLSQTHKIVCHLSAFNLYLKSTLYEEYRGEQQPFPPIDRVEDYFEAFQQMDSELSIRAFEEYALDIPTQKADPESLTEVVDQTAELSRGEGVSETIGSIFETLVPNEGRKRLGQFRTPDNVADFMVKWAVDEGTDRILDPGMGAGILTTRAYQEKLRYSGNASIDEVSGVDLSQLAILMSATALKILDGEGSPDLRCSDFLDTQVMGQRNSQLDTEPSEFFAEQFDTIISNPPYSQHNNFSEQKERMNERARASSSLDISLRSPMYVYFYIHAAEMLREGGKMAFLTPSEFLETEYGTYLKEFLQDRFNIRAVVMPSRDSSIFDTGRTTACICLLEKCEDREGSRTTFISVSNGSWPDVKELLDVITPEQQGSPDWAYVNQVDQDDLDPDENWTNMMDPESIDNLPELKQFSDIATIKRGIATGNNDFFCLSENEAECYGLVEERELVPIIRRTHGLEYHDIIDDDWEEWKENGEEVYLLYNVDHVDWNTGEGLEDEMDEEKKLLWEYIDRGKREGVDQGYLTSNRGTWYKVERREIPDILCDYMSQTGFSFYENNSGVRSLNNLHNIYLDDSFTQEHRRALLAYLNSELVNKIIQQSGRTYSEELRKVEPNELKRIPVVDPRDLHEETSKRLSMLFEDLCDASRNESESKISEIVRSIDNEIAEITGIDNYSDD